MGVTPSAISHQIRGLTAILGEALVVKSGRGIALTTAGRQLHERLAATFSEIEALIEDVVGTEKRLLRVAVCSSFGPSWLAPRLPAFHALYPDIEIELRLYAQDPEQTQTIADAVVTALPVSPGYETVRLFDEMLVAVAGPGALEADSDGRSRLITSDLEPEELGQDWIDYARHSRRSLSGFRKGEWIKCTHYVLAMELAKCGMGLALVPDFLAERDLRDGHLLQYDKRKIPSGRSYALCFKTARASDPTIRAFAKWITAEATGSILKFPSSMKATN